MNVSVAYSGGSTSRFDRNYYVQHHLPLVRKIWEPVGLEEIDAFFPANSGAGFIAMAICRFRDAAAYQAAMKHPGTPEVMADIAHFTDIKPVRFQFAALDSAMEDQDA